LTIELGDMTSLTASGQAARLIEKAELNGIVAIAIGSAQLEYAARTCLEYGDRDCSPGFVKNLSHPDLTAE
jgi:hypothetical protein